MGMADVVLDNPILVKHLRSRLRLGQALPWAAVVLVLAACAAWAGHNLPWIGYPSAVVMLLGLQVLVLALGGMNQITTSLGGARESGILDFHRVSPVPPGVVALGFFLGAPIREYALAVLTLPFAAFAASHIDEADPARGLAWFAELEVGVLTSTWIAHGIAMLACLARKKPRGSVGGAVLTVILLLIFGSYGSAGFWFGAQWLLDEPRRLNFFGRMIPWLAWLLIYQVPALGFLALAVARKMRAERTHAFTKPQALACMATLAALMLGGTWGVARLLPPGYIYEPTMADAIMIAAAYALSLAAIALAATITPAAGEYIMGVRRAGREGRRRPSPWSDAGSNRIAVFGLGALVLVGATAVVNVVGRQNTMVPPYLVRSGLDPSDMERMNVDDATWLASRRIILARPIAIGVLTVAYVGLGFQYFSLRTRRSGPTLMALFLFAAWLVPLLAGAILGLGGPVGRGRALAVLALSPLPGLALSTGLGEPPGGDAIRLAALAPAVTFAFVFNYLLVGVQRKLDRSLRPAKAVAEPGPLD